MKGVVAPSCSVLGKVYSKPDLSQISPSGVAPKIEPPGLDVTA